MGDMVALLAAFLGATGFWELIRYIIDKRTSRKGLESEALLALLHDRIYELTHFYLAKGEIGDDEYENLQVLNDVYKRMHGNHLAKKQMALVEVMYDETHGYEEV
jgi:hypothetical protein